ncbi:hypothetical protein ZOD2009_19113 [Haladaptatus paucihalophilus DX253]|uniref:Uncharacterized protein n=1 Tax=Haladaptatus paucihalophilus DX253 TaxID=797209 RepID=E7QYD2_HALPU|nr:hypothetical protein [Haladaptatus paucihalophilus]EFW90457.1 hypothetical protein ZOD2009_19113 [Haladaptatus paucihalophilus DX253]SHL68126.1 hypothetical protein SAMN05444342_4395 [Haladaptatus paucihalophilus DX253]
MSELAVFDSLSALVDGDYLIAFAEILLGALVMEFATGYLREKLYDVQMKGGDAIYGVLAAVMVLLVPVPDGMEIHQRNVALGCLVSGGRVFLSEVGGI